MICRKSQGGKIGCRRTVRYRRVWEGIEQRELGENRNDRKLTGDSRQGCCMACLMTMERPPFLPRPSINGRHEREWAEAVRVDTFLAVTSHTHQW